MIKIYQQPELNVIAVFIAKMNTRSEHHIGYCGNKADEILHTLETDFTDVPAHAAFVTATEEDEIIGVCGFDANLKRGSAEIWGPFVDHTDASQVLELLWDLLLQKMPDTIHSLSLFPTRHNRLVFDFAESLGFRQVSDQTTLTCIEQSRRETDNQTITTLSKHDYIPLVQLHDQIFPDAYLTGQEMVAGLNKESIVFGAVNKNGILQGYLYAEADPKFAQGSVEFVGVDSTVRGKGIGSDLLVKELQWLFSFQSIDEITLGVRSDNSKAIHLYEKNGFSVTHELTFFQKNF